MTPLLTILGSKLRTQCREVYERSIHLKPQSENPYATHVPVLIGVASAFAPDSLIEFGAGTLSTLSFVDELVFPSFQKIESYENDRLWFDHLRTQLPADGRVDLRFFEGDMFRAVSLANISDTGMIFIDDSPSDITRVPTVTEVAARCGSKPIVVLHDAGLWRLRLTTRKFENRVFFDAYNPQSCVMWNAHPERRQTLENVNRLIHRYAGKIPSTSIRAWKEVFSREL